MTARKLAKRVLAPPHAAAAAPAADYVPLLTAPDAQGIFMLKDGSLAQCWRLRGKDTETLTQDDKDMQAHLLQDLLRHSDSRLMLWVTVLRRRVQRDYRQRFEVAAAQRAHDAYIEQFADQAAFDNELYLTLVYQTDLRRRSLFDRVAAYSEAGRPLPAALLVALADSLSGKRQYRHAAALYQTAHSAFQRIAAEFAAGMQAFGMETVGEDALYTLYHRLVNPAVTAKIRPPASPATPACGYLAASEISRAGGGFAPGLLRFETAGAADTYCAALAVHEWSDRVHAGVLDALLAVSGELTVTVVCDFMDDEQARKMLGGLENKIAMSFERLSQLVGRAVSKGGYDEGGSGKGRALLRREVEEANARTISEQLKWAHGYVSLLCFGDSMAAAEALAVDVAAVCRRGGFTFHREKIHLLQAWSASLPGQWGDIIAWWPLTWEYLSDLIPLRSLSSGEQENPHFTAIRRRFSPALTVFRTRRGSDYFLDLHAWSAGRRDADNGHFACIAPTARGKTVLINWLIFQFRRYDPTRIIVLDKDLSCKIPLLLQGGEYLQTGRDSSGGAQPLRLNPLCLLRDESHIPFLAGWLMRLLAAEGAAAAADDLTAALRMLRAAGSAQWSLSALAPLLPRDLAAALKPWLRGGIYGDLDHNGEDGLNRQLHADSYCVGIDLKRVFDDEHFAPVCLDYILYAIELALAYGGGGARPGLLYIEESWKVLRLPRLAGQVEEWLRTLRKKNFAVGLTTQSLREFKDSGLFEILTDSIPNLFFLGNPQAAAQRELYAPFGVNSEDITALSAMAAGQFLYIKTGLLKKHLKFTPPPPVLRMLSVNEAALAEWERLGAAGYLQAQP